MKFVFGAGLCQVHKTSATTKTFFLARKKMTRGNRKCFIEHLTGNIFTRHKPVPDLTTIQCWTHADLFLLVHSILLKICKASLIT